MRREWQAAIAATVLWFGGSAAAQELPAGPPPAPSGVVASFQPPAHDAAGYLTPNRGLSPAETMWHLRVALNVAALGCRGAGEAATVAGYNALLATERAALAAAADATAARYRASAGAGWQARYDDDMTRLYNFWAQPGAHDAFCAAAAAVLQDAAVVDPANFDAFAVASLPRLEAPFVTWFAAVDAYREQLASWRARQEPEVAMAMVAPVAVNGGPTLP